MNDTERKNALQAKRKAEILGRFNELNPDVPIYHKEKDNDAMYYEKYNYLELMSIDMNYYLPKV